MVSRYLLALILLVLAACPAVGETVPTQPIATDDPFHNHDYHAMGLSVDGRLAAYGWFPSSAEFPPQDRDEGEGVVFLREYLWYPNPLSSPSVVVVVTEPASFQLDIRDVGNELLEHFEFCDVATGVYFFLLEDPILPVRPCSVRLMLDGVAVDRVPSRTHRGSYGR